MPVFKFITETGRGADDQKKEVTRWKPRVDLDKLTMEMVRDKVKGIFGTRSSSFVLTWFDGYDYCKIHDISDIKDAIDYTVESKQSDPAIKIFASRSTVEHKTIFGAIPQDFDVVERSDTCLTEHEGSFEDLDALKDNSQGDDKEEPVPEEPEELPVVSDPTPPISSMHQQDQPTPGVLYPQMPTYPTYPTPVYYPQWQTPMTYPQPYPGTPITQTPQPQPSQPQTPQPQTPQPQTPKSKATVIEPTPSESQPSSPKPEEQPNKHHKSSIKKIGSHKERKEAKAKAYDNTIALLRSMGYDDDEAKLRPIIKEKKGNINGIIDALNTQTGGRK